MIEYLSILTTILHSTSNYRASAAELDRLPHYSVEGIYIFIACFFMLLPIVVWLMFLFRNVLHALDRQVSCER